MPGPIYYNLVQLPPTFTYPSGDLAPAAPPAVVTTDVGPFPWTPTATNINAPPLGAPFDISGQVDGAYDWDMGILQMPVAGPPGTQAEIIRVHSPAATRAVEWTVEGYGYLPTAPSWQTGNPNEQLKRKIIYPMTEAFSPAGDRVYRLSGRYEYYLVRAPGDNDPLSAGKVAISALPASANDILPSQFDASLLADGETLPAGFKPGSLLG